MKQTVGGIAWTSLLLALGACSNSPTSSTSQPIASAVMAAHSPNGAAGERSVYYDGELFTVNMKEVSDGETLENNPTLAEIYAYNDLDEEQDFLSVIDAVQGEDNFSPLWEQFLIVFNPGFAPHQFFSEEEVEAAAEAGEITLVETEEIYRCSIVGKKLEE